MLLSRPQKSRLPRILLKTPLRIPLRILPQIRLPIRPRKAEFSF